MKTILKTTPSADVYVAFKYSALVSLLCRGYNKNVHVDCPVGFPAGSREECGTSRR